MAVGDILQAHSSTANDATVTVAAAAAGEATIHNFYTPSSAAWELYRSDGTNEILLFSCTGPLLGYVCHVQATAGVYLKMKNKSGGTVYMGFDGIVTK